MALSSLLPFIYNSIDCLALLLEDERTLIAYLKLERVIRPLTFHLSSSPYIFVFKYSEENCYLSFFKISSTHKCRIIDLETCTRHVIYLLGLQEQERKKVFWISRS